MANVWMHNGFLQVEGEKMAKSAGNFVTIRELLESWPGEALRLNMLKSHYRQPIDWTLRSLEDSKRELDSWASLMVSAGARGYLASDQHRSEARTPSPDALDALSDDLNTPEMLAVLREDAKAAKGNKAKAARLLTTLEFLGLVRRDRLGVFEPGLAAVGQLAVPDEAVAQANRLRAAYANGNDRGVRELTAGLETLLPAASVELSQSGALLLTERGADVEGRVEALIEARRSARMARNFAESDRIRDELAALGVALKDNKDGTTTWEVAR
jgi:cysteinyl-tRNA synthetase